MKVTGLMALWCSLLFLNGCNEPSTETVSDYPITPVNFTQVILLEGFWKDRIKTGRNATVPFSFNKCQETGRIDNFIFAGGIKKGKFQGRFGFNDSDLYKIMEGAAYSLMLEDAKYIDVLERSLYNGVISGLSLDGTLFFYPNTLQYDGEIKFNQGVNGRSPWFACSCCPSNLSRFVPSVAGYAYAAKGEDLYVNLFMNSGVSMQTDGGLLTLSQQSGYPWNGDIRLEIQNEKAVEAILHIRIPGWAMNEPVPSDLFRFEDPQHGQPLLKVNGNSVALDIENGYAILHKAWKRGDVITLNLVPYYAWANRDVGKMNVWFKENTNNQ